MTVASSDDQGVFKLRAADMKGELGFHELICSLVASDCFWPSFAHVLYRLRAVSLVWARAPLLQLNLP